MTNTGQRAGDEVVQLYVRDDVASVTRPVKELKGFQRVTLQPGETQDRELHARPEAFRMWNDDMKEVVEPGQFEIMAGPNSADLQSAILVIA